MLGIPNRRTLIALRISSTRLSLSQWDEERTAGELPHHKAINLSDAKAGSYAGAEATASSDGKMTAGSLLVFLDGARGTKRAYDSDQGRRL
jgi:hypothetical protein